MVSLQINIQEPESLITRLIIARSCPPRNNAPDTPPVCYNQSITARTPAAAARAGSVFVKWRHIAMMTKEQAREFASRWLPAWTGNDPAKLASFYSDDALYLDPAIPGGVKGKEALLKYFEKLLAQNPDWVWTQIEGIPMEGGFLNKWRADIPVGAETLVCVGVCFVQFDDSGKIRRNEVYFDRTPLVEKIMKLKNK